MNNPRRMGDALPPEIDLERFQQLSESVAASIEKLKEQYGDAFWLKLIETFGNEAVDMVSNLKMIAATPRHLHGDTHNYYDRSDNRRNHYERNERRYNNHYEQHTEHTIEVNNLSERFYKIGPDLIISTSGQFTFRPLSRQLVMATGTFELNQTEATALLERLKYDYRI